MNSGEHCHFCKIMNVTQEPFQERSFENEDKIYEFEGQTVKLFPDWLTKLGRCKLCKDCFKDSGYDKLNDDTNVKLSGAYSDEELVVLKKNKGLYLK